MYCSNIPEENDTSYWHRGASILSWINSPYHQAPAALFRACQNFHFSHATNWHMVEYQATPVALVPTLLSEKVVLLRIGIRI